MAISTKKNYIYQMLYQILNIISPLITAPYIARMLGADGIGTYSYTQNIVNYFLMIAMLGVQNYGTRSIAEVKDSKKEMSRIFWSIYDCQLILSSIMLLGYALYLMLVCDANIIVAIAQTLLLLSAFFDITWLFQGLELFKLTVTRNMMVKVTTVVCIFIFVKSPDDVWKYTVIMAGGTLLAQISIFSLLKKYVYMYKPTRKEIFAHFKPNLTLFLPVIASSLFNSMDKIMVGKLSSLTELGYYENAEKITNIPNSFITSLGIVMLPRMTYLSKTGKKVESEDLLYKSFVYVSFMSAALTIGIISVSTVFVPWFLGKEFNPVSSLLLFLSPALIFMCWATVIRTQFLIPRNMDKEYLISMFLGAGVNIVLNVFLIKNMGAKGASLATLIAETVVCFVQIFVIRKYLNLKKIIFKCIPFYLFGTIMYLCVYKIYIINEFYSLIVRVAIGGIIYLSLSCVYLFFSERQLLVGLIKQKRDKS